ncbi:2-dehydropantoate 2-reductase [Hydrogenivirga caldilitoris]|uniref:2-dehydropantoate 2-reductase n=1 Tax=Hydrogenivirga caldilitoris TaxID=246264 RepID=A0A497XP44_9AQUI|nr:2-dehydropantoate 2-reductase [Hydrogenivirga caldilitoris]RLJ70746.1 2-dehydropantoate 2-reductase [Hydrogenivirga caldilitoris]
MKFLIVGVGAIGSAYLAFLTKAGHDAIGLVKRGRKLNRISVRGIWGEFDTPVKTVEDISLLGSVPDLIILSVKSYDTVSALELIRPVFGKDTLLMIAQNGYGNYEAAVERYGKGRVILARVIFGSRIIEPGAIEITVSADDVVIGDPSGILSEKFLTELADIFTRAGIPTRYEREVYRYLWDKIIYNCALNPLGALLEVNYGTLSENPHTRSLMDRIIYEIFEVTRSAGIETFWKSAEDYKRVFYEKLIPPTAAHFPSMLADIKRGKTEIDALNGAICKLGEKHNVATPVNMVITELVKAKELLNREF